MGSGWESMDSGLGWESMDENLWMGYTDGNHGSVDGIHRWEVMKDPWMEVWDGNPRIRHGIHGIMTSAPNVTSSHRLGDPCPQSMTSMTTHDPNPRRSTGWWHLHPTSLPHSHFHGTLLGDSGHHAGRGQEATIPAFLGLTLRGNPWRWSGRRPTPLSPSRAAPSPSAPS